MTTLGSNKDTMKLENRRQVLRLIRQGPRSRAGLAKETGLSQAAIGNMVASLVEEGILQEIQTEEEECETDDEFSDTLVLAFLGHEEDETYGHQRDGERGYVYCETENGNEPGSDRSTYIGTHYHTDGIGE